MDIVLLNLGLITLMGLIALIAGIFEDLESDVASTSNPNSQVQLAPQIGNLHKFFNRAVSGEPLLVGTMATISGSVSYLLLSYFNQSVLVSLLIGTLVATVIQVLFSISSYMGRITSQALYNQPLFMDVIYKHIGTMAGHAFISLFSITLLSYIMGYLLQPASQVALPILTLLWGITLGSIGSSVGDIHYGAEEHYQNYSFGSGTPVSINGWITTKSAIGSRNSIDVANFCSKFGGPLTGLCFGLIVFLSFWTAIVFGTVGGIVVGLIIVVITVILNTLLERNARIQYGKYQNKK